MCIRYCRLSELIIFDLVWKLPCCLLRVCLSDTYKQEWFNNDTDKEVNYDDLPEQVQEAINDFVFAESIETIIKELADKDNHYTNRNTYVKYDT